MFKLRTGIDEMKNCWRNKYSPAIYWFLFCCYSTNLDAIVIIS